MLSLCAHASAMIVSLANPRGTKSDVVHSTEKETEGSIPKEAYFNIVRKGPDWA